MSWTSVNGLIMTKQSVNIATVLLSLQVKIGFLSFVLIKAVEIMQQNTGVT